MVLCGSRMQSQQEKQQQAVRWGFNTCARGIVSEPDTEGLNVGIMVVVFNVGGGCVW